MQDPLINDTYLLEKYPGKGGWTYAAIPELTRDSQTPFGWTRVRGTIDNYQIKGYSLMPMGEGRLFLPVKAEIRKKIGKQAGDFVRLVLFKDDSPLDIPEELSLCLDEEPLAKARFEACSFGQQKALVEWIMSAKRIETRAERIAKVLRNLEEGRYGRE